MFCSILNCIAPLEARHELSHIHLSPGPAVVSVLHSLSPPSLTQHRLGLSDSAHRLGDLASCVVQTLFEIRQVGLVVAQGGHLLPSLSRSAWSARSIQTVAIPIITALSRRVI